VYIMVYRSFDQGRSIPQTILGEGVSDIIGVGTGLIFISVNMFMDFLGYGNHVSLYSEEISRGGEGLGVSDNREEGG
jgi:hypothetical protein